MLKVYNTSTGKKEIFKPIHKGRVGMYSCGPTVYWYQHIGNLRTYISNDILKRVLQYNGLKVKHVINVTDVGHLTSDQDTGEDKIEKAARRERKTAREISDFYFKAFRRDLKKLNIIEPDIWPRATEHIREQIALIKILERKGYTYKTSDGIYFDASKLRDYGKLAKLDVKKQAGKRISVGEKKNPTDFALWKFSKQPGIRQQEWKSPWGIGFPGWHLECSAMASKYLGKQFDIHTGGQEHIQIHHTNEIAQSESAFGKKPWVRFWIHFGWLLTRGEKVSKSEGGLYTISELEKKGFDPLIFRYMTLTTHYRKPLNFSLKNLEKSQEAYQRLRKTTLGLKDDRKTNKKYLSEFEEAVNNDLDMPKALQVLWGIVRDERASGRYRSIKEMDEVLGLDLLKIDIPLKIKRLAEERESLRKKKDWKRADQLRRKIEKAGHTISDVPGGGYFISGTQIKK